MYLGSPIIVFVRVAEPSHRLPEAPAIRVVEKQMNVRWEQPRFFRPTMYNKA
jgi:hypothetical protein